MGKVSSRERKNQRRGRHRYEGAGSKSEGQPEPDDGVNDGMQSGAITRFLPVVVSVLIGIVAVVLSNRFATNDASDRPRPPGDIDSFLRWFVRNGGYLNPAVTVAEFPDFGGYGLAASYDPDDPSSSEGGGGVGVKRHDVMLRVPSRIILTAESVLSSYVDERNHGGAIRERLLRQTKEGGREYNIVRQDYAIALGLMVECSLGDASEFRPYLDVLPRDVPRLDTFSDEELDMLQDDRLAALARESVSSLRTAWKDEGLKDLVDAMATSAAAAIESDPAPKPPERDGSRTIDRCLTFGSFRRFVSIASSRAMVVKGKKYLVPLADMANYAPRNDGRRYGRDVNTFLTYHRLDDDTGAIIVDADRDVSPGEQIFEDYGDTDNSLYLEAHGFVPDVNPFHCAVLDMPDPGHDLSDESREVLAKLKVLKMEDDGGVMKMIVPTSVKDACIMVDNTLTDQRAISYLAVYGMMDRRGGRNVPHGGGADEGEYETTPRDKCLEAARGDDAKLAVQYCLRYAGNELVVREEVERAARRVLADAPTTLDEDLELLRRADRNKDILTMRGRMALRFRIEEKKILMHYAKGRQG